jgi:hypothetical protein
VNEFVDGDFVFGLVLEGGSSVLHLLHLVVLVVLVHLKQLRNVYNWQAIKKEVIIICWKVLWRTHGRKPFLVRSHTSSSTPVFAFSSTPARLWILYYSIFPACLLWGSHWGLLALRMNSSASTWLYWDTRTNIPAFCGKKGHWGNARHTTPPSCSSNMVSPRFCSFWWYPKFSNPPLRKNLNSCKHLASVPSRPLKFLKEVKESLCLWIFCVLRVFKQYEAVLLSLQIFGCPVISWKNNSNLYY